MPDSYVAGKVFEHHHVQLELCERLERMADSLPNQVDVQECLLLARDVYPAVRKAHEFEEQELFPLLEKRAAGTLRKGEIERLRYEHWEDEDYAEEISRNLSRLGRGECAGNSEKIAWLLRGFFSGVRRHLAYEVDHLLPILHGSIKPKSIEPLADVDA